MHYRFTRRGWLRTVAVAGVGVGFGCTSEPAPFVFPRPRVTKADGETGDGNIGCTIVAATGDMTRTGGALLFSNSDDPLDVRTRVVVVQPEGGLKYVAAQIISPPPPVPWGDMPSRGMNEAGFAFTWSFVSAPAVESTGISFAEWGRLLLSSARTIDDALNLIEAPPRAIHGNFLFADASGEICLVEIGTEHYEIIGRTYDGSFKRTNHWLGDMLGPGQDTSGSTGTRLDRVTALIDQAAGTLEPSSWTTIGGDHDMRESGLSICVHGEGFGTVSGEVSEPSTGTFWYSYGWPCGERPTRPEVQPRQDRSWGRFVGFPVANLEPGEYVTIEGDLTGLARASLGDD